MIGAYVVEGVLAVLLLACFILIARQEWLGRGVFRWHDDEREES